MSQKQKPMVTIDNYDPATKTTNPQQLECTIVREHDTHYRVRVMLNGEERVIRKHKDKVLVPDQPKAEPKSEEKPKEKKPRKGNKKKAKKD